MPDIGELAPRSGGLFMGPPNKTESALVWYGCRSENGLYIKKETRRCSIFYANFIFRFFCVFNMKGSHRSWKKIFCEIISIGRPPPPSVGTKDQIFRQIQFEGSPILYWKLNFQYNITIYIWVRKYPGVMQAKANWREWVPRARPGTLKPLTWKSSSPTMGWRRETWSRVQEQQPLKVELLWLKKYIS